MSEEGTSPSAGAKPRWMGFDRIPDQPKWVWQAIAFNLAMQLSGDVEMAAATRLNDEIPVVRRMYASPRTRSSLQIAAQNREA